MLLLPILKNVPQARGNKRFLTSKLNTDMAWIFFDTATPKRGVQLSHDIESVTCEDKAIKIYFKEDGFQQPLGIVSQPSRARKLPILVSFPSKEDANTAFVGMAEQMAKETGNWFIFPAPEPSERKTVRRAAITYPFTDRQGKRFRVANCGITTMVFEFEDGTIVSSELTEWPPRGE